MRYGHLLAFSTLLLAKEETFVENSDFEKRMHAYAKICSDLKVFIMTMRIWISYLVRKLLSIYIYVYTNK